jgi:hypothetical protein
LRHLHSLSLAGGLFLSSFASALAFCDVVLWLTDWAFNGINGTILINLLVKQCIT